MAVPAPASPPPQRMRSTPYARRLARERGLLLASLSGSGPDGRITGADVLLFRSPQEPPPVLDPTSAQETAPSVQTSAFSASPSALSVEIDFDAAKALLAQIGREHITHEAVALKAVGAALDVLLPENEGVVQLSRGTEARRVSGIRHASLSGIAAISEAAEIGEAEIAVSFLTRSGVRPVAARLEGRCNARLVVGFPGEDGMADCLLSFDPDCIEEDAAAEFLLLTKEWIETPLRLLV